MIRILNFSIVLFALAACSQEPSPYAELADTEVVQEYMGNDAALARGQAIFEGSCASFCHTMEPAEEVDASYLFDCEWNHGSSDQDLFNTVTNGVLGTRMVGFGSNFPEGDDDLWKVIAYLRSNQQAC